MNIFIKNLGLAFGLALMLLACEDPNDLAKNLAPDHNLELLFEDIPIDVSLTLMDSILTGTKALDSIFIEDVEGVVTDTVIFHRAGAAVLLAGSYTDDYFGQATATAFSNVSSGGLFDPNDDATIESFELKLDILNVQGTDFDAEQRFLIYELGEQFDPEKDYYSNESLALGSQIGDVNFFIDSNEPDTLVLSMPLDLLVGQGFIDAVNADTTLFDTDANFLEFFKGIAIVPNPNNTLMFSFNAQSAISEFKFEYIQLDTAGLNDTLTYSMPLFRNGSGLLHRFSNITSDRSATNLAGLTSAHQDFQVLDDIIGAQAGTGIVPVIRLENAYDFLANNQGIKLNRAEILIKDVNSSNLDVDLYSAPNLNLFLTDVDKSNFFISIADSSATRNINQALPVLNRERGATSGVATAIYDDNEYQVITTVYFEEIDNGVFLKNDFLIVPQNYVTSLGQFTVDKDNIKLHLYYSSPK